MLEQMDLKQLRALSDVAHPGPWEVDYSEEDNYSIKAPGMEWGDGYAWVGDPVDAALIAATRNAIPHLLDQLAQAKARIQAVEDALEEPDTIAGASLYISVDRLRRALDGGR